MVILLQQLATSDTTAVGGDGEGVLFFFELLLKGGFWLVPLVILWGMAIYIFFERLRNLNRASKTPFEFMEKIKNTEAGRLSAPASQRRPWKPSSRGGDKVLPEKVFCNSERL